MVCDILMAFDVDMLSGIASKVTFGYFSTGALHYSGLKQNAFQKGYLLPSV